MVGGSSDAEGRVEIYHNGAWGTVCDDGWSDADASVVCRQLGYSGAASARTQAFFGQGSGPIYYDDVVCSGSETRLADCSHPGVGVHNCAHTEDAGVVCDTTAGQLSSTHVHSTMHKYDCLMNLHKWLQVLKQTSHIGWLKPFLTKCTIIQHFVVVNGDAALQMLGNFNTMLQIWQRILWHCILMSLNVKATWAQSDLLDNTAAPVTTSTAAEIVEDIENITPFVYGWDRT